jgi:hypothetical protein
MTNNDTITNPTITLNNMGGTYIVEVDALNLAMIQVRNRGLLLEGNEATFRRLAADACGYRSEEGPFRAWADLEVLIAWVESGNFV